MKAVLRMIVLTALVVAMQPIGRAVTNYLEQEQRQVALAVKIVRADSYQKMLEAEAQGNVNKMAYYRWRHTNAEKIVADIGADAILRNKKSRKG
ncbi:MAG: hypothetical protein ACI3XC_02885 [Phascolarctobacterium sp.]